LLRNPMPHSIIRLQYSYVDTNVLPQALNVIYDISHF